MMPAVVSIATEAAATSPRLIAVPCRVCMISPRISAISGHSNSQGAWFGTRLNA